MDATTRVTTKTTSDKVRESVTTQTVISTKVSGTKINV